MTLQQASVPGLPRPAKRRDRQRFWQEVAMIAPAVLLLAAFLITPFLLSFWTAMTNQPLVPRLRAKFSASARRSGAMMLSAPR